MSFALKKKRKKEKKRKPSRFKERTIKLKGI